MEFLPLLVSTGLAAGLVPIVVSGLSRRGYVRQNYRGAWVAFPSGVAIVATALVALVPLSILGFLAGGVLPPGTGLVLIYVVGVALLGLLDDLVGGGSGEDEARAGGGPSGAGASNEPRGWRGHARVLVRGRLSTGALKAAGALALALFVMSDPALGDRLGLAQYLLAVAVLVLATNLFNLLDLRPGRSAKALLLLGSGLTLATFDPGPLWLLGLFVGPILALLPLDLRERAMLGDTGSNAIGALAGLWLVLSLPPAGLAVALALMAVATVYGEFRSISALIERTPVLRRLDSFGRASHA